MKQLPDERFMRAKDLPLAAFYAVISLLALFFALSRPFYNWDLITYLACAKEFQTDDPAEAHAFPYREIEEKRRSGESEFPAAELDSASPFRIWMKTDPAAFSDQLLFYRARVGYIFPLHLLISAGMDPIFATHFISALSIFLSIWILFLIVRRRVRTPFQYAILPLALGLGMMETARLSTADGLALLVIMAAFYLFVIDSPLLFFFLPLLILVKTDLLILILLFSLSLFMMRPSRRIPVLICVAFSAGLYFFLHSYYHYPGWETLLYFTFTDKMTFRAPHDFSLTDYFKALAKVSWDFFRTSEFLVFSAIAGLASYVAIRLFKGKPFSEIVASKPLMLFSISLVYVGAHTILFPQPDTRFFVGLYIITAVSLFAFLSTEAFNGFKRELTDSR